MKDYLRKHKQMVTINTWLANDPARVRAELTDMSNKMGKPAETSDDGEWWVYESVYSEYALMYHKPLLVPNSNRAETFPSGS